MRKAVRGGEGCTVPSIAPKSSKSPQISKNVGSTLGSCLVTYSKFTAKDVESNILNSITHQIIRVPIHSIVIRLIQRNPKPQLQHESKIIRAIQEEGKEV